MKTVKTIILLIFTVLYITDGYALEKTTHEAVNEVAANISSVNDYLTNQLKITDGLGAYYSNGSYSKKAIDWIAEGGSTEDEPYYSRSFNHYLNPINNTGYNGIFKSALEWSHSQGTFGSLFGGDYSWPTVRSYYFNALTSTDKATRDNNFAYTFQGVGQLMHLVTDMSVPAHTRNDGHILYNYENWVAAPDNINISGITPVYFFGALPNYDPLFLDLAAFSNANFFSDDTIFDPNFPNPAYINTNAAATEVMAEDGLIDRKPYIHFTGQTYKLAAYSYFSESLNHYTGANIPVGWHYVLDDAVYSDYASLLLPRAVGYSADLLSYFFRGQMSMDEDKKNTGSYKITNNSTESMNGVFSLYYDDRYDNRNPVSGADLSAVNGVTLAPGEISASIPSFTEPSDIKEKGKYMLVFEGNLGSEQQAVVGKAVTLGGGKWEDWDKGAYTPTYHYNFSWATHWYMGKQTTNTWYFNHAYEFFTFASGQRSWNGVWQIGESPEPSISVDGKTLTIDASTGGWPLYGLDNYYTSYNRGWLSTSDTPVASLAGCRLEMDIPSAEVGYKYSGVQGKTNYTIELTLTDGNGYNWRLNYAIDNVSTALPEDYILISTGKVKLSLEDGFNHLKNVFYWYNFGDISNWKITNVRVRYGVSGIDNYIRVAVDYIDFVCDK